MSIITLVIAHVEPNGTALQPNGLSTIAKVYGNNIFQGFLKKKNFGSKLNFHRGFQFSRFQANFLTCKFPFLPTFAQLLCPSNGFLQCI
jgi:hypothetical protein